MIILNSKDYVSMKLLSVELPALGYFRYYGFFRKLGPKNPNHRWALIQKKYFEVLNSIFYILRGLTKAGRLRMSSQF